jgi:hypothetical protein
MEAAESHATLEFDPKRQAWIAGLDYTHQSLDCHLQLVNEDMAPLLRQVLSARQFKTPTPD